MDDADPLAPKAEVRKALDEALRGDGGFDPETWGESPEAQAGVEAAMSLAGGS